MPTIQVKLVMTVLEFDNLREAVELARKTAAEWQRKCIGTGDWDTWQGRKNAYDCLLMDTLA